MLQLQDKSLSLLVLVQLTLKEATDVWLKKTDVYVSLCPLEKRKINACIL
jgi:hypothetical protein